MGLYGSAPTAPDPNETAAAQTSTNLSTAIGNSYLGNINQVTPDGTLTYTQGGQNFVSDPNGQAYSYNKANDKYIVGDAHKGDDGWTVVNGNLVPSFTATTELSPMQDKIKRQEDNASLNLATLANSQSNRLDNILGKSINLSAAPMASNPRQLNLPDYQKYTSGPKLQTKIGDAGDINSTIAGAGNINNTIANAGNIQNSLGTAGDITKSYDTNFDTSAYSDAIMARLNPQLQQDSDALNAKLVNQGLQPGSEAYNRAFAQQGQKENDARVAAVLNAGQEQSRLAGLAQQQASFQNAAQQQGYDQQLGSGNFANAAQAQQYQQNANNAAFGNTAQAQQYQQNANDATFGNAAQAQQYSQNANNASFANAGNQQMYANKNTATSGNNALADQEFNARRVKNSDMDAARTQYLNEQYANRNQSLNEITGLMSGAQVQNPNFVQTNGQTMPTVDYAGLVNQNYQNQLAAYQQNQAGIGQLLGGIGSIAALSDKRAKKDIEKVGKLKGMNLYEYSMRGARDDGKRHIGVMAQEVIKKRPDAVTKGDDGLLRVKYGKLFAAGAK